MRVLFEYLRSRTLQCASWILFPAPSAEPLDRLGSDYGGWSVPLSWLGPDAICYCAGVGEDITFDLALIAATGAVVHAFDPTPRAVAHVRAAAAGQPKFVLHPEGLWKSDTTQRFYAPRDPAHVSHSILNLQATRAYFDAPCRRLSSKMRELGHPRLDLLKLDVEGAEYAVLDSLLEDQVWPRILCVEFDSRSPFRETVRALRVLLANGYRIATREGWNYTLLYGDPGATRASAR